MTMSARAVLGGDKLHARLRKAFVVTGTVALAALGAHAQPTDVIGELLDQQPSTEPAVEAPHADQTVRRPLTAADLTSFRSAVESAQRGRVSDARVAIAAISDPVAKKAATWVLVDSNPTSLSFFEADQARRELDGWPRDGRRREADRDLRQEPLADRRVVWRAPAGDGRGRHGPGVGLPDAGP